MLVTARKRAESALEIPSSIQALSGDELKEMGARSMADYVRFMPAVTVVDYGAGSSTVVFRGKLRLNFLLRSQLQSQRA